MGAQTNHTQRLPNQIEVDLQAKTPTETVPKGMTKPAHDRNNTALVYQLMNNKALPVVDNYYPYSLDELLDIL